MVLADEIGHNQVQDHVGENEIGESPFGANVRELRLVLRVGLNTQSGG